VCAQGKESPGDIVQSAPTVHSLNAADSCAPGIGDNSLENISDKPDVRAMAAIDRAAEAQVSRIDAGTTPAQVLCAAPGLLTRIPVPKTSTAMLSPVTYGPLLLTEPAAAYKSPATIELANAPQPMALNPSPRPPSEDSTVEPVEPTAFIQKAQNLLQSGSPLPTIADLEVRRSERVMSSRRM
jgi:hypothetical protein